METSIFLQIYIRNPNELSSTLVGEKFLKRGRPALIWVYVELVTFLMAFFFFPVLSRRQVKCWVLNRCCLL